MLRTRVLTALVAAPLGLAAVFMLPETGFRILIATLFGLAAREWCQFIGVSWGPARLTVGITFALLVSVLQLALPLHWEPVLLFSGLGVWLAAMAWLRWRDFGGHPSAVATAAKIGFGLTAFLAGAVAAESFTGEGGDRLWFFILLLIIWGADVGAYFCGRMFGKRKLAPNISPGKTWEGVWGGQLLVLLICAVAAWLMALNPQQILGLMLAGVLTAAVSVVGDLLVSLMKRQVGLKDAGRLFPGHGGVLDRFDSLIAAMPVFALSLQLLKL